MSVLDTAVEGGSPQAIYRPSRVYRVKSKLFNLPRVLAIRPLLQAHLLSFQQVLWDSHAEVPKAS